MNTNGPHLAKPSPTSSPDLTLLLLRLLEHLLDDLLLLDEESTDDPVLDAVCASRTTVKNQHHFSKQLLYHCNIPIGALDGLLGAADGGVFARTESGDTSELDTTVLGHVSGPHI